jgi:hypothetical protein
MLVCGVCWGVRPWTVLVIPVAAAVVLLTPAVAGGLAATALIGFASCAFALCWRTSTLPPARPRQPSTRCTAWSSGPACRTPST